MRNIYQLFLLIFAACLVSNFGLSQVITPPNTDGKSASIDVNLENIFNQKTPRRYKVANVAVSGNQFFDAALLVSIANLNVGDEVLIPGCYCWS